MLEWGIVVGLLGPDPSSKELFSQTKPALLALSATIHGARTDVSPDITGGGVLEPSFHIGGMS